MKIKYICSFCHKEKETYISNKNNKRNPTYCSNKCKWEHQKETLKGENNPNFDNRWPEERKKEHSKKIKETYKNSPELRYNVGKSNRGKKFSSELIAKMHHPNRTYNRCSHSEETKKEIGIKSAEKFTPEFKREQRKIMEERGYWRPINELSEFKLYKLLTEFEFGFGYKPIYEKYQNLIKEHGIFHNKNNRYGVVRDHIIEKSQGLKHKIFPELIKHPANCQILTHTDNVKKGFFYRVNDISDKEIEELFQKIINFNYEYRQQEYCLFLIKEYKIGKRWNRHETLLYI